MLVFFGGDVKADPTEELRVGFNSSQDYSDMLETGGYVRM